MDDLQRTRESKSLSPFIPVFLFDRKTLCCTRRSCPPSVQHPRQNRLEFLHFQLTLGVSRVEENDKFLRIGGDSFRVIHLMERLEKTLGVYDVRILESILKDTLHATSQLLGELVAKTSKDSGEQSQLKRDFEVHSVEPMSKKSRVTGEPKQRGGSAFATCEMCGDFIRVTGDNISSPLDAVVISLGSQYVGTHRENTSHLAGINGNSCQDQRVVATANRLQNSVDLTLLWKHDTGKCVDASPLVIHHGNGNSTVFIGSHSHKFAALDLDSGECRWEVELGDRVESSACVSKCGKFVVVGTLALFPPRTFPANCVIRNRRKDQKFKRRRFASAFD